MNHILKNDIQWDKQFQRLKAFRVKHGHVNVHHNVSRSLYSWVYKQRCGYRKGSLSPLKIHRLSQLGMIWNISRKGERRAPPPPEESVLVQCSTPPQDTAAAECLMQMSRNSKLCNEDPTNDEEESESDEEFSNDEVCVECVDEDSEKQGLEQPSVAPRVLHDVNDLHSIDLPFCEMCKGNKAFKHHHTLCPKSANCNESRLFKIISGVNAGCHVCMREFEHGYQSGRHEGHTKYCSRSKFYKPNAKPPKAVGGDVSAETKGSARTSGTRGSKTTASKASAVKKSKRASKSSSYKQRTSERKLKAASVLKASTSTPNPFCSKAPSATKASSVGEAPITAAAKPRNIFQTTSRSFSAACNAFRAISPDTSVEIFQHATVPQTIMLPDIISNAVTESYATVPPTVERFVPPLITVDTNDLDELIYDLKQARVGAHETLERLEKIRRLAF